MGLDPLGVSSVETHTYRQILNLRTLVLKFSIFGNDVKYQEFKATERSEGVLKFGTSRYVIFNISR